MYHVMAIANYEDRFVIPTTHREYAENTFDVRGGLRLLLRQRLLDGGTARPVCSGRRRGGRKMLRHEL